MVLSSWHIGKARRCVVSRLAITCVDCSIAEPAHQQLSVLHTFNLCSMGVSSDDWVSKPSTSWERSLAQGLTLAQLVKGDKVATQVLVAQNASANAKANVSWDDLSSGDTRDLKVMIVTSSEFVSCSLDAIAEGGSMQVAAT